MGGFSADGLYPAAISEHPQTGRDQPQSLLPTLRVGVQVRADYSRSPPLQNDD